MQKRIILWCICTLLIVALPAGLCAETVSPEKANAAIVYFSKTGNTRTACETVAKVLSADIFEIKVSEPPAAKGQLPVIETLKLDLAQYSLIVVASPVWAANLVPAVRAFLKNNPLGEKKVILLTTTNAAMPEKFQEKHKKLVADAGGLVAGYYQLVMMEKRDDKTEPREPTELQKEIMAIADKIKKTLTQ